MVQSIALPIQVPLQSIALDPGSRLTLGEVGWETFEAIQAAIDERPGLRVAYCDGMLELVSPLPAHERFHRIIARNRVWCFQHPYWAIAASLS